MNKQTTIAVVMFFLMSHWCQAQQAEMYDRYFTDQTMRVDYHHSGTATEEYFAIDRILNDGIWPGSRTVLIDELDRGPYFFEVIDRATGNVIYSRHFASIFGEWQYIPEAKEVHGTFHESIRFPWPENPVEIVMKKRNEKNVFETVWTHSIDPEARNVNKAVYPSPYQSWVYFENGPPAEKVDIIFMGDGYTREEMQKFREDVKRLAEDLFSVEPFTSRRDDFNVRAVETPSNVSGVNRPHPGIFKRTALSVSYSAFDSERYALSYDNRSIRDAASTVPYDFMIILMNERTYGGGGIYRLYVTAAADNRFSDYLIVHEFGHHFGALGDEYYTSSVAYEQGEITVEPWEPNVTALLDKNNLKWKDLVVPSTPIPTPWNKEAFDAHSIEIQKERKLLRQEKAPEEQLEALFLRQKEEEIRMIEEMQYNDVVGAFEGSGYHQYGLYRPYIDCIMFSRNRQSYCPVCRKALEDVIEQYCR